MKNLLYAILSLAIFTSCENEQINTSVEDNETVDLRLITPNKSLDNSNDGMYAGVIVADNNNFHGKLWINLNNNQKKGYSAMIETIEKEIFHFKVDSQAGDSYVFVGDIGSFNFDSSNIQDPLVSNVTINNTSGNAEVLKEKSNGRMEVILGTYNSEFLGTQNGTWNFIGQDTGNTYFIIDEVVVTTDFGGVVTQTPDNYELGLPGCITFPDPNTNEPTRIPPAVTNNPNDPGADFAILAVNQSFPTGVAGQTVFYDVAFSQDNADLNTLPNYNYFTGFPEATRGPLFGDPALAEGCYNIPNGNGFYYVENSSTGFVAAGRIFIDVSSLVSPLTTLSQNLTPQQVNTLEVNPQF